MKIGINGFGRIGRLTLRNILKREGLKVVAINDLYPAEYLAYLLKYDSSHGKLDAVIEYDDNLSLKHISEHTSRTPISYEVYC